MNLGQRQHATPDSVPSTMYRSFMPGHKSSTPKRSYKGISTIPRDRPRPFVLIVMDGWGINPRKEGNTIALAHTPTIDRLAREWPHTAVKTSGEAGGSPEG